MKSADPRLWTFYVGCLEVLKSEGYLTKQSICAGISGGSIGALLACVDSISSEQAVDLAVEMAVSENFLKDIDRGLKASITSMIPSDAVNR